jgi:hypothetical protein
MDAPDEFRDELSPLAIHNGDAIDTLPGAQDEFSPQSESLRFRVKAKTDVLISATAYRARRIGWIHPGGPASAGAGPDLAIEEVFEVLRHLGFLQISD